MSRATRCDICKTYYETAPEMFALMGDDAAGGSYQKKIVVKTPQYDLCGSCRVEACRLVVEKHEAEKK